MNSRQLARSVMVHPRLDGLTIRPTIDLPTATPSMPTKPQIVLGTSNQNKRVELAKLLAPVGIELQTLADFSEAIEVVEDGDTFAANAALKATEQARHLGRWVLAEDSGEILVVGDSALTRKGVEDRGVCLRLGDERDAFNIFFTKPLVEAL